jgi:hypothetical protein
VACFIIKRKVARFEVLAAPPDSHQIDRSFSENSIMFSTYRLVSLPLQEEESYHTSFPCSPALIGLPSFSTFDKTVGYTLMRAAWTGMKLSFLPADLISSLLSLHSVTRNSGFSRDPKIEGGSYLLHPYTFPLESQWLLSFRGDAPIHEVPNHSLMSDHVHSSLKMTRDRPVGFRNSMVGCRL